MSTAAEDDRPLSGVEVVTVAVNLPGPVAAARFAVLGAHVTKVEPPTGDPLAHFTPDGYAELNAGQDVVRLDLKDDTDRARLADLLGRADVLITSHRPSALARLGLSWEALHAAHPRLVQVAIVGDPGDGAETPGHDLTYQAVNGLVETDRNPRVLVADLGGGDRAVIEGLAALLARGTTGEGRYCEVALSVSARDMGRPLRWGMTGSGALLGGGFPAYGVYASSDGHVAVAALEPHFQQRLEAGLGVDGSAASLTAAFATRTSAQWVAWAAEHDVPVAALPD